MQIFLARDIALESMSRDSQEELWERILRDDYMKFAVEECYFAIKLVLTAILDDEGKMWFVYLRWFLWSIKWRAALASVVTLLPHVRVERIYDDIQTSITKRSIHLDFDLNKLALVISRVTAVMGILVRILFYSLHIPWELKISN